MSLFAFELRKIWRQKRIIWPLLFILLIIGGTLYQNNDYQETMGDRAKGNLVSYSLEADGKYVALRELGRETDLTEQQDEQLTYINQLATAIFEWDSAISNKQWGDIPEKEFNFLTTLKLYEQSGGHFEALKGLEREKALEKNEWIRKQQLSYEDEAYPISPALITKESANIVLGAGGLFLLILLFGTSVTAEKEQQTWSTIKTQPIPRWRCLLTKYSSMLVVTLIYIAMFLIFGWLIPFFFGDGGWNYQYPQLFVEADTVTIISTQVYLLREIALFLCATFFTFAFVLFLSNSIKRSFSMLMMTGFICLTGFMITDMNQGLQVAWNPFQFFRFTEILAEVPQQTDWLYPIAAIIWSALLIGITILLPERETDLFKVSGQNKPFQGGKTRHWHVVWENQLFSWRKIKRQGLLSQLFITLFLFILIGYILIAQQTKEKEIAYVEGLNNRLDAAGKSISWVNDEMIPPLEMQQEEAKEVGDNLEFNRLRSEIEGFEGIRELYEEIIFQTTKAIKAYEEKDWRAFYEYQRFKSELDKGEYDTSMFLMRIQDLTEFTAKASIAEKDWLIAHPVQPIFSGGSVLTIYDDWGDQKEFDKYWKESNQKVDDTGLFSLYLFFDNYLYYIPLLILLFIVGTGFASERGKRPTLHLLRVQPMKERSIFLGKLLNAGFVSIFSGICLFLFILLVGTIFNRLGDWNYPILHYHSESQVFSEGYTGMKALEGGFNFIPLGTFLVETMALFLFILLFLIVLSHVLALFKLQNLGVLATVILVSVGGYFTSLKMPDLAWISPFTYLNITKIGNGELATILDNPAVTVWNGCMVLAVSIVVLSALGCVLSGRRHRIRQTNDKMVKQA